LLYGLPRNHHESGKFFWQAAPPAVKTKRNTMKISTALSSIALVAAMTLSGAAFAQTMIGDVTIPEGNLASFQEKCAAINSAATESLSEKADAGNDSSNDDTTATASTTASGGAATPAAGADANTTTTAAAGSQDNDDGDLASEDNLDELLASMTPEQCKEAGLSPGAM